MFRLKLILFLLVVSTTLFGQFRTKQYGSINNGLFQTRTPQEKKIGQIMEFVSVIGFGASGYFLGYSQELKRIDPGYSERGVAYGAVAIGLGTASAFSLTIGINLQGKFKLENLLSLGCGTGFFFIGQEIGRSAGKMK